MLGTERVDERIYVTGNTYPYRDKLKELGAHWDGGVRAWWVGLVKKEEVERLVEEINNTPPTEKSTGDPDTIVVIGKAVYKGRTYYVRQEAYSEKHNAVRVHLVTLDAKISFWASVGEAEDMATIVKRYPQREYRGRTEKTTLGSIKRFIESQKDPKNARGRCTECDEWGPVGQTCTECHEGTYN